MGICTGTAARDRRARTLSRARSKEAFSRSILLMTARRATPNCSAKRQARSVCTSTPCVALTSTRAPSATRRAGRASAMKLP
jgi:hypothetical protein